MFVVVLFILIGLLFFCFTVISTQTQEKKKFQETTNSYLENNFEIYLNGDNNKFLINKEAKQIVILYLSGQQFLIKFEDILNCEIIENGSTSMSTVSQKHASVGKAIVGGALFGPAGAIIGGTSGKTNSRTSVNDVCNELMIKITINDLNNPCVFLNLLTVPIHKASKQYRHLSNEAQKLLSLFQIIINENEKDTNQ